MARGSQDEKYDRLTHLLLDYHDVIHGRENASWSTGLANGAPAAAPKTPAERASVSRFRQKATALASTVFFNKRIPRPSRTRLTRRSGGLKPASSETAKRESASWPPFLAKPRNLFAVSVNLG